MALLSAVVRVAHYPAQALLDAKNHRKKMTHDFTYSGIITCGHCGCSMVAELKKGRYVSSHCTNGKGTKCPEPYTREEILTKELTSVRGELVVPKAIIPAARHLGISPSLIKQLPNQDKIYFGVWNFDNYQTLGRTQSNNYTDTFQAMFSAVKVAGPHTLKAGLDIRQINYEIQNAGSILNYTGNTGWTQDKWTSANSNTGDGYASFLLGITGGSSSYPLFPWWLKRNSLPVVRFIMSEIMRRLPPDRMKQMTADLPDEQEIERSQAFDEPLIDELIVTKERRREDAPT